MKNSVKSVLMLSVAAAFVGVALVYAEEGADLVGTATESMKSDCWKLSNSKNTKFFRPLGDDKDADVTSAQIDRSLSYAKGCVEHLAKVEDKEKAGKISSRYDDVDWQYSSGTFTMLSHLSAYESLPQAQNLATRESFKKIADIVNARGWKEPDEWVGISMGSDGKYVCQMNNPGELAKAICPYIIPQ